MKRKLVLGSLGTFFLVGSILAACDDKTSDPLPSISVIGTPIAATNDAVVPTTPKLEVTQQTTNAPERPYPSFSIKESQFASPPTPPITKGLTPFIETYSASLNVVMSGDYPRVAVNTTGDKLAVELDDWIGIYEINTGELLAKFLHPGSLVSDMAWSPNGELLAVGTIEGPIHIWSLLEKMDVTTIASDAPARQIKWSPDGKYLLLARECTFVDCKVRDISVWTMETGTLTQCVIYPNDAQSALLRASWSPDGKLIASAGYSFHSYIFDREGLVQSEPNLGNRFIRDVAWSPDGRYIASGGFYLGGVLDIWDTIDQRRVAQFIDLPEYVFSLVWSPDGKYLAYNSQSDETQILTIDGSDQLLVAQSLKGGGVVISWSADGKRLVTIDYSNNPHHVLRIWDRVDIAFSP